VTRPDSATPSRRVERQPGGRPPAPGQLGLIQAFINTRWDLDRGHEEQLQSPAELAGWLERHDLLEPGTKLRNADLRRALDFREGLRALLFANNGEPLNQEAIDRLNRALNEAPLELRFEPGGTPDFVSPGSGLDAALGSLAVITAAAQIDGSWVRLKACPGVHCGWAFYDHSRNQSGNWCSMSVCGSRTKAREYRRRKRGASA
jgi:predicted RNA-binding Zn ribbon-like protein